jgi:hypothetical protein
MFKKYKSGSAGSSHECDKSYEPVTYRSNTTFGNIEISGICYIRIKFSGIVVKIGMKPGGGGGGSYLCTIRPTFHTQQEKDTKGELRKGAMFT